MNVNISRTYQKELQIGGEVPDVDNEIIIN